MNRREFVFGTVAATAAATVLRPGAALASREGRFVLVFLEGGADGAAMLPPYGDKDYVSARGTLALPNGVLEFTDINGQFALHPALSPLHRLYLQAELSIFPSIGLTPRTVSHAEALKLFAGEAASSGENPSSWLHRALIELKDERAVAITRNGLPVWLRGPQPIARLSHRSITGPADRLAESIADLHRGETIFASALSRLNGGNAIGNFVEHRQMQRNANFLQAMHSVGSAFSSRNGPRIASIEFAGWDTHANQGGTEGRLSLVMKGLADGLTALRASSAQAWQQTVVLIATEFGRAIMPNREHGTDHGVASVAFLLGGAVDGGRVIGRWPGLATPKLYGGHSLMPTVELQSLFKSVLVDHLGLARTVVDNVIFPYTPDIQPLKGLLRA